MEQNKNIEKKDNLENANIFCVGIELDSGARAAFANASASASQCQGWAGLQKHAKREETCFQFLLLLLRFDKPLGIS